VILEAIFLFLGMKVGWNEYRNYIFEAYLPSFGQTILKPCPHL